MFQFFTFLIKIAGLQSFKKFDMLTRNDEIFKLFPHPTPNPPLPQPHTKIILQAFSYLYSEGETRPSIFVTMYKDFQTREREKKTKNKKKYIYGVHIYMFKTHNPYLGPD